MSALPPLVEARALALRLDDPGVRVFDASVVLRFTGTGAVPDPQRDAYRARRLPGAAFVDPAGQLSDPDGAFPLAVPDPTRFAAAAGELGIGEGIHVVVYQQQAPPVWATRVWWLLRYFGFDDVSVLDGGLPAWRAAGLPTATGDHAHPPATFVPRPRPELLARRGDVEAAVAAGDRCLINALPTAAFRGEQRYPGRRAGRIATSVSVPAGNLIDPTTSRFRSADELRSRLARVGALDGRPPIAYCGGGIAASLDVFALSLVGRDDARLYDASLAEWATDPDLPMETG